MVHYSTGNLLLARPRSRPAELEGICKAGTPYQKRTEKEQKSKRGDSVHCAFKKKFSTS